MINIKVTFVVITFRLLTLMRDLQTQECDRLFLCLWTWTFRFGVYLWVRGGERLGHVTRGPCSMGSIPAIVRWLRVQPCGEKPAETSKELPHENVLLERSFCVLIEVLTLETDSWV